MSEVKENKMGIMPVNKLLVTMSIPMIVSMLVQALYNVVDSIFVAKVSENALTAVSLAFPIQTLMISVAGGTGVGMNALLSKCLGEKNFEKANKVAMNGMFLALASYIVFAVIGLAFSSAFFRLQTNDAEIIAYGESYMYICLLMSFGLFFQFAAERTLQSTGRTFYTMITQATGAIINIVLDPVFIFGLFGAPRLEVAGAAIATVIGQICAAVLAIIFNFIVNKEIHYDFRHFRPDAFIIKGIYAVGVPSIIMQSVGSVMTFGMNKILMGFMSTAAAVFGVYFKLQSFVFMPVFGLNNGMVPIIAYNYGARKPDRIVKVIKLSVLYAFLIMLIGFAIFQLFPELLLSIFDASEHMIAIGTVALRIVSFSFLLAGYSVICSSVFQALGHGVLSLIVSVMRQLIVLLPAAYILSRLFGLDALWLAFPFAELVCFVLTTVFILRVYRKEIMPLSCEEKK